jgi:hypothetical protein
VDEASPRGGTISFSTLESSIALRDAQLLIMTDVVVYVVVDRIRCDLVEQPLQREVVP